MKHTLFFFTLCVFVLGVLTGCGQSGKLYLPNHTNSVAPDPAGSANDL